DGGRFHPQLLDQYVVCKRTDRIGFRDSGEVSLEGVLILFVVVMYVLRDLGTRRTDAYERNLESCGPRLKGEYHFTDVAGGNRIHMVTLHRPLEGAYRIAR